MVRKVCNRSTLVMLFSTSTTILVQNDVSPNMLSPYTNPRLMMAGSKVSRNKSAKNASAAMSTVVHVLAHTISQRSRSVVNNLILLFWSMRSEVSFENRPSALKARTVARIANTRANVEKMGDFDTPSIRTSSLEVQRYMLATLDKATTTGANNTNNQGTLMKHIAMALASMNMLSINWYSTSGSSKSTLYISELNLLRMPARKQAISQKHVTRGVKGQARPQEGRLTSDGVLLKINQRCS